jgi:hypothetical protein
MSVSYENIYNNLIPILSDILTADLSTIPDSLGDPVPSVIRSRQDGPKPDLPYLTVNITSTVQPSGPIKEHYINADNLPTYEYLHEILITYECCGLDSQVILSKLRSYLKTATIRDRIRAEVDMASVQIGSVTEQPELLTTAYEESHGMLATYYHTEVFVDELADGTYLETVTSVTPPDSGTLEYGALGDKYVAIKSE